MAYSDFTLASAVQKLALIQHDREDMFHAVAPVDAGHLLPEILADSIPLATAIHTEKARSELIVMPILLEAWRRTGRRVSLFSGVPFDVDPSRGLSGVCDFLLSRSPSQFILGPPVLAVVEAKNDSIQGGLGQCAAEMVAARIFKEGRSDFVASAPQEAVYGVVTTGSLWRFLRLRGDHLEIDRVEYMLGSVGKILAILLDCLTDPTGGVRPSPAVGASATHAGG